VRVVVRFLVAVVLLVDFLGVGFTVVLLAGFAATLLPVFATVVLLLDAFEGVLLTVRVAGLLADLPALPLAVLVAADASINGFVFFDGSVARTCLIAVVCSWSVIRNSWCPSRLATK
jgi:hypothetical protein